MSVFRERISKTRRPNFTEFSTLAAYSASEVTTLWRYTNLFIIIILTPGTQLLGNEKIKLCNTEKYKKSSWNKPTLPLPPSQNSHAVIIIIIIVVIAVARSSSGGVAICCVLPVLWMTTSCLPR